MEELPPPKPLDPKPPAIETEFLNDKRLNFLLEMYRQMMNDINRHITIIWQTLGVVGAAVASMALVEKQIVSLDVAITFIVLTCAWSCAQMFDAGYWYNRNLCIIANIERQFLKQTDLKDIHYYFGSHRPDNKLLNHLRNQLRFVSATALLMVGYHLCERIIPELLPCFRGHTYHGHPLRALPEVTFVLTVLWLNYTRKTYDTKYAEFIKNSPGITIDTSGIEYGVGHGFSNKTVRRASQPNQLTWKDVPKTKILILLFVAAAIISLVYWSDSLFVPRLRVSV